MNFPPSGRIEIDEMILAVVDMRANDAQFQRLEELLQFDGAATDRYLKYSQLEYDLHRLLGDRTSHGLPTDPRQSGTTAERG